MSKKALFSILIALFVLALVQMACGDTDPCAATCQGAVDYSTCVSICRSNAAQAPSAIDSNPNLLPTPSDPDWHPVQ